MLGELEPAALVGARAMKGPKLSRSDQLQKSQREVSRPRGRSDLVVHDSQCFSAASLLQDLVGEIASSAPKQPRRPHDEMSMRIRCTSSPLSSLLRSPVCIEWSGGVLFVVGFIGLAIEHVIGGDEQHGGPNLR